MATVIEHPGRYATLWAEEHISSAGGMTLIYVDYRREQHYRVFLTPFPIHGRKHMLIDGTWHRLKWFPL